MQQSSAFPGNQGKMAGVGASLGHPGQLILSSHATKGQGDASEGFSLKLNNPGTQLVLRHESEGARW